MLHRAVLGSLERFIGILIENYAGALPAVAGTGAGGGDEYLGSPGGLCVTEVAKPCVARWRFRVEADLRNEKINYKIREHSLQKLPYQLVVGDKEKVAGMVAVRARRVITDLGQMTLDERFPAALAR
jgi:threonyl-tRNA synthetase